MADAVSTRDVILYVVRFAASATIAIIAFKKLVEYVDPTFGTKKKSKLIADKILKELGVKLAELTEHEAVIATHIVSGDTNISWSEVGGYVEQITDLQDNVILPLKIACDSKIFSPPSGVLLYGPPGCGKTLIAKAMAKAAGARFINLQVSTLTDMWYGESNKLVAALFSLAKKLQPAIIFIDEIDSFLRTRKSQDHEATAMLKASFMSLWDGFSTQPEHRVIVLGATNRPQDVDDAILRRMPCRHYIGPPSEEQRHLILKVILKNEKLDDDVNFEQIARMTAGFSGSDLKEVARLASVCRVKDSVAFTKPGEQPLFRPLSNQDFLASVDKFKQCRHVSSYCSPVLAVD